MDWNTNVHGHMSCTHDANCLKFLISSFHAWISPCCFFEFICLPLVVFFYLQYPFSSRASSPICLFERVMEWHCGNFSDLFVTMVHCGLVSWNCNNLKFIILVCFYQRNHHGPAENTTDPSQASQNGSVDEKNNNVSPLLPKNVQNLIESDFSMTTIQKDHTPGSTTEAVPLPMQMRLDMFDPIVSSGMATQHLQEPVSNVNMPSHTQPQLWLNKQSKGNYIVPHNDTMKEQEELVNESGSDSISSAYSQGWVSYISSTVVFLHQSCVNYLLETTSSEGEQCVCAHMNMTIPPSFF